MRKILEGACILFLCLLFLGIFLPGAEKIKEKDLSQKYQEWLKLASYIILPEEKDVFLQLTTDRDRDIFIESFWKQRDPTPGTPQNEYKDEHTQRFLHASKYYSRGTPREGWMTDMGRIYIILGQPSSIERFEGTAGIHSCQVWYYFGDKEKRLPAYFALVFYQRGGAGEYKLYSPASDGPASLLIDTQGLDLTDYQKVYERIKELAPTLAGVSISMIPGQYPYNYQPSPQNNIILANIFESPQKDVSPSYATHFLNYKGIVSTEYLINYIESSAETAVITDPILNINFLHFSISPKSVSLDYFEPKDQYYCNFQLNVSLRKEEEIIFQYSKDFPFYFPVNDLERVKGSGIAIQDYFPLIEGKYRLNLLVQNSVGKEFSSYETDVLVPDLVGPTQIVGPVLGYGLQDYAGNMYLPFKVLDKKILIDPQHTLSLSDKVTFSFGLANVNKDLWNSGKVRVIFKGTQKENPQQKSLTLELELKNYTFNPGLGITHSFQARELSPDYYEIQLELINGKGMLIDIKKANFILSPSDSVPHPTTLAKAFPLSNNFLYWYSLAFQYEKAGNFERAETSYKRAYDLKPDYKQGVAEYARFLVKQKKYPECLSLIENLKDDEEFRFQYYLLKGKALMGMENFSEAILSLLEGNKIYDSDTELLNSLGFCYYKTGERKKSLDVFKASLNLNPDQAEVKKIIEEIGNK